MSTMRECVAELEARRARAAEMGGPERIAKQHGRGRLRELASNDERRAFIESAAAKLRAGINPYVPALRAMLDDVIDPRQTRAVVVRALECFANKRVERPWRKRGVVPV